MNPLFARIPPSVEIRLLIHEMNFNVVSDEALYVSRLRDHGVHEMRALDAYRFVQVALGRRLKAMKGVPFPDAFLRFDTTGRLIDAGRLSEQALFQEVTNMARAAFSPWTERVIGVSSPEVHEASKQIADGRTPEEVALRPCLLFTKVPGRDLVEHALREADRQRSIATEPG